MYNTFCICFASGVLSDKTQAQGLDKSQEMEGVTENQTNILLIGVDGSEQMCADTLMLLSLNRTDNSLAVLSIPVTPFITTDKQDNKIAHLMTGGDDQKNN